MAKLNKTRILATALIGTIVMGASIPSHAQNFRSSSQGFNTSSVSIGFTNRGISAVSFNTRNNIGFRQTSRGFNNRLIGQRRFVQPVFVAPSRFPSSNIIVKKPLTSKVIVRKQNLFSTNRRGFR